MPSPSRIHHFYSLAIPIELPPPPRPLTTTTFTQKITEKQDKSTQTFLMCVKFILICLKKNCYYVFSPQKVVMFEWRCTHLHLMCFVKDQTRAGVTNPWGVPHTSNNSSRNINSSITQQGERLSVTTTTSTLTVCRPIPIRP